jgi:hypothetical protein
MPIAWFIIPYKRDPNSKIPARYPAIDDYTTQIYESGGQWSEAEILGNRCLVKVRATTEQLSVLASVQGFRRLPKDRLDDPLSDLPARAKQAIKDEILDAGYTLDEVQARFGDDLGTYTLRDVLRFMTSRRLKPRYDVDIGEIILDGEIQSCRSIENVDNEVQE